jgi:hypothetical protein
MAKERGGKRNEAWRLFARGVQLLRLTAEPEIQNTAIKSGIRWKQFHQLKGPPHQIIFA